MLTVLRSYVAEGGKGVIEVRVQIFGDVDVDRSGGKRDARNFYLDGR